MQQLLRKGVPWNFDENCKTAFTQVKQALISAPVLTYPDFTRPFILCTDASDDALGAVLEQADEQGKLHPIGFYSRPLRGAERNYTVTEKEAFAIYESVRHWKTYLGWQHFDIYCDQKALEGLERPSKKISQLRVQRWRDALQEYNCTVHHRAGKFNVVHDALSRLDLDAMSFPPVSSDAFVAAIRYRNHSHRYSHHSHHSHPSSHSYLLADPDYFAHGPS